MQKQESVMKNQLTNGGNSMSDPITVIKPENAVTKIPFNERYTLTKTFTNLRTIETFLF